LSIRKYYLYIESFFLKQFNPWNTQINSTNANKFVVVDQLRSILDDDDTKQILTAINTTNVKRFYLGMEFNKINNEEFYNDDYYSLNLTMSLGRTVKIF
jgi:hypothetical protein